MGRNPLGFWVEGPSAATDFSHPFPVYVSGGEARVGKGLVIAGESFEPVIGKVPVSGDAKHPQPTIKLDDALVDDLGQTWVCVEATPDKDGKLDPAAKTPQVVVVQRDHPSAMTGDTGRAPLALIVKKNNGWQVYQVAFFHLRYTTVQPASGPRRHYFL